MSKNKTPDLSNPCNFELMQEVPQLVFNCHSCNKIVAEVSDKFVKDNILYGRVNKFKIYCQKCHDDLDAVQAKLNRVARLIFFTNEQLLLLQKILENETQKYLKDQALQDSIKNDDDNNNYDIMDVNDERRYKINAYRDVCKMYRKVNKSLSELGLLF